MQTPLREPVRSTKISIPKCNDESMAVMMMMFLILNDWNHATMCRFTQRVLELDRRVIDAEVV